MSQVATCRDLEHGRDQYPDDRMRRPSSGTAPPRGPDRVPTAESHTARDGLWPEGICPTRGTSRSPQSGSPSKPIASGQSALTRDALRSPVLQAEHRSPGLVLCLFQAEGRTRRGWCVNCPAAWTSGHAAADNRYDAICFSHVGLCHGSVL